MTKTFKFVDIDKTKIPTLKRKNVDGFRFYEINGKAYPSITTILSIKKTKELQEWRKSIGEDVANYEMRRAAGRGNAVHKIVEHYIKGETPTIRNVLPLGLFRLLKPYVDQIDNVHMLEQSMYSDRFKIAGQSDCIAEYNGKLSVIDFKTANKEKPEEWIENYFLQCTAYAEMYEDVFGTSIDQIVVLIAAEDGSMRSYIKEKKDYVEKLKKSIEDFYKYYEEQNKNKVKS